MRTELRIADVRAAIAQSPFRWVIVQVRAQGGLKGLGETWYMPGVLEALRELRPLVVGEDARNVEMLVTKLLYGKQEISSDAMDWEACVARYGQAGGAVVEGPTTMAAAGLEMALWDLVGRALGAPVWALLGGQFRGRVRMYADLHLPEEAGETIAGAVEAAHAARETGFDAVKVDADLAFPEAHRDPWNRKLSGEEIAQSRELVGALRRALGSGVDVAVDCHFQFSVRDAVQLGARLADLGILWLEDPVPYGDPALLEAVARGAQVPVCFGEYVPTAARLYPYVAHQACHVIHPDVAYAGLTEAKKMAALADIFTIPCALHNSGGPIATVASAHLASATRNFLALENHNQGVPWWRDLLFWKGPKVEGGCIDLKEEAPGLGVDLDERACKRYVSDYDVLF